MATIKDVRVFSAAGENNHNILISHLKIPFSCKWPYNRREREAKWHQKAEVLGIKYFSKFSVIKGQTESECQITMPLD